MCVSCDDGAVGFCKTIHHWQLCCCRSCDWEGIWLTRMTFVVNVRVVAAISRLMNFYHLCGGGCQQAAESRLGNFRGVRGVKCGYFCVCVWQKQAHVFYINGQIVILFQTWGRVHLDCFTYCCSKLYKLYKLWLHTVYADINKTNSYLHSQKIERLNVNTQTLVTALQAQVIFYCDVNF